MKKDISIYDFSFEDIKKFENVSLIHNEMENGYVNITFYPFLPGIIVSLNDVHTTEMPISDYLYDKDMIIINYCISGRCEFKVSENVYRYVKSNYTSIGSLIVSDRFYYPSNSYLGFEIYIYREMFTDETINTLKQFNIDVEVLGQKYNNKEKLSILETDIHIQRLWMELYNKNNPDKGLIQLNILKILHYLSKSKSIMPANTSYLTRNQAKLAKEVQSILTADISKHISMREISAKLNVSETSLKNYFSAMFGVTVSEYMKSMRLKKSAELLAKTELPISDIAISCGFSNQGRFAKVFKEYYGMLPLEYRHHCFLQ